MNWWMSLFTFETFQLDVHIKIKKSLQMTLSGWKGHKECWQQNWERRFSAFFLCKPTFISIEWIKIFICIEIIHLKVLYIICNRNLKKRNLSIESNGITNKQTKNSLLFIIYLMRRLPWLFFVCRWLRPRLFSYHLHQLMNAHTMCTMSVIVPLPNWKVMQMLRRSFKFHIHLSTVDFLIISIY